MTTIEKNKVIAEFMGARYAKDVSFPLKQNEIWLPIHGVCNYDTIELGQGHILCYHSSWDWLMPVIQKLFKYEVTFQVSEMEVKSALCYETIEETHQLVYHWITKINEANNA